MGVEGASENMHGGRGAGCAPKGAGATVFLFQLRPAAEVPRLLAFVEHEGKDGVVGARIDPREIHRGKCHQLTIPAPKVAAI